MKSALLSWLSNLDVSDIVLNSLLALGLTIVAVSAYRSHKDPNFKNFNLLKLICHPDGTPSRPAIQEIGAFVITSWGFVLLINKGNLAEWYMMSYLGFFVARAAHSAYLNSKNGNGEKK
jgi:hypothetical protein